MTKYWDPEARLQGHTGQGSAKKKKRYSGYEKSNRDKMTPRKPTYKNIT